MHYSLSRHRRVARTIPQGDGRATYLGPPGPGTRYSPVSEGRPTMHESETTVRPATIDDTPVLVEFNVAMARETEDKALAPEVVEAGVRRVFDEPARGYYLVAESDGQVVGALLVTPGVERLAQRGLLVDPERLRAPGPPSPGHLPPPLPRGPPRSHLQGGRVRPPTLRRTRERCGPADVRGARYESDARIGSTSTRSSSSVVRRGAAPPPRGAAPLPPSASPPRRGPRPARAARSRRSFPLPPAVPGEVHRRREKGETPCSGSRSRLRTPAFHNHAPPWDVRISSVAAPVGRR